MSGTPDDITGSRDSVDDGLDPRSPDDETESVLENEQELRDER